MSYSPESRHSKRRHRDRSRSRSRSSSRSERRRSKDSSKDGRREGRRKSRWHDDDDRGDKRDRHDDKKDIRTSKKSCFSDTKASSWKEPEGDKRNKKDRYDEESDQYSKKEEKDSSRSKQSSSVTPGPILMFRNLTSHILKEHLTHALGHQMSYIKDIRLISGRESSSNYAFVEFYTTDDAVNWMDANKNGFEVRGCHVNVDFSHHRSIDGGDKRRKEFKYSDWNCFKCGTLNFSRRTVCLTCDCCRTESDSLHEDRRAGLMPEMEVEEESSKSDPPSNVLIFRGLDGLSTEESIEKAISDVSDIKIKDVRLIKDKSTNTSRRFCFVETITTEEAAELNKVLMEQHPAFFVDGRRINVSYARVNTTTLPKPANAVATAAIQQAQAMNMLNSTWQNKQQHYYYSQSATNMTDSTKSAVNTQEQSTGLPSTYLYDSTSGFYYDTITRLYYDPKTQYHYNSLTGQYCYYDTTKQSYIPVLSDGSPVNDIVNSEDVSSEDVKDKKKIDTAAVTTGKSAKKIAKDMERWAKSINNQKVFQQQILNQAAQSHLVDYPVQQQQQDTNTGTNDQFGLQEETFTNNNISTKSTNTIQVQVQAEDEPIPTPNGGMDMEHINLSQLACLLCKRKFNSKDQLMKHIQVSDLHKQNLEKHLSQTATSQPQTSALDQMLYRDRAKERRAKYGTDAIVPGWKKRFERERAKTVASGDTVIPTETFEPETENIGTKMLKAMGWNEGQGLGKEGQGIINPIEAEKRNPSAGLGAPGSNFAIYSSGNDYRATLKSLTKARYDQTFD